MTSGKPFLSIGKRLLFYILLCSGVSTTIFTGISFYLDFESEQDLAANLLTQIEVSAIGPLTEAYYNLEEKQIEQVSTGVLNIHDVVNVVIYDESQNESHRYEQKIHLKDVRFGMETWLKDHIVTERWDLLHPDEGSIGSIEVSITRLYMYSRLATKALYFFLTQGLKTLLVSLIILFIVDLLLTRHLRKISQYWTNHELELTKFEDRLELERDHAYDDEIDLFVASTNNAFEELARLNYETKKYIDYQDSTINKAVSLASLGEIASGVAHEVNNPLAIILGCSEIIDKSSQRFESKSTYELVSKYNEKIRRATERISSITYGLLEFSEGTESVRPSANDINRLINLGVQEYKRKMPGLDLPNLMVSGLDFPLKVKTKTKEIEKAIASILINAAEHTTIASDNYQSHWVKIYVEKKDPDVSIFIVNSGPKILPDHIEKIFLPFYTTKPVGKGAGLGLSVALGLVESNGGTLKYSEEKSHPGFQILLPIHVG